jgi:magnesium-transporting ATPase (P-type)
VTIALAQGARAMAERGAIVRRLNAVETLGAATVVAADKTGTLTRNQLRVETARAVDGRTEQELLEAGALASTAELLEDGRVAGDPVDGAFLLATDRDPRRHPGRRLVAAVPFDPWRKRLTAIYDEAGERRIVVKGAPEMLIERARALDGALEEIRATATAWAADGLRVLAVAERRLTGTTGRVDDLDSELDLIGLVGLRDPLRPSATASVGEVERPGSRWRCSPETIR